MEYIKKIETVFHLFYTSENQFHFQFLMKKKNN